VPPFGANGGGDALTGENSARMLDGHIIPLKGNDEIDLPAGATFILKSPGGGGWGAS
jgi:5-oxoprolinase (ATP-hydrolysing)